MCLALYIGSEQELPLAARMDYPRAVFDSPQWPKVAQRLHTSPLAKDQEVARKHFSVPHVVFAGSYEGCSCGFNYGREYPDTEVDPDHVRAAQESIAELVKYIRNNAVNELYICWFGDESVTQETERVATVEELLSPSFFFRQRELVRVSMPQEH